MLTKGEKVVFEDADGSEQTGVVARVDGSGTVIVRIDESGRAKEVPASKIRLHGKVHEARG